MENYVRRHQNHLATNEGLAKPLDEPSENSNGKKGKKTKRENKNGKKHLKPRS